MRLRQIFTPPAAVIALAVASTPAFADQRERAGRSDDRGRSERIESQGRAVERPQPRGDVAPRGEIRPQVVVPRAAPRPEVIAPRVERPVIVAPRVERPVIVAPRMERPWGYAPRYEPRYEPRYAPRFYGDPLCRPYVFRPRLHIGFGMWLGYPVPYAYAYPYPVPIYGYAAPAAPVVVGPGSTGYGGVSLEISPSDAAVYVDGVYAGTVSDFDGTHQPLTLTVGAHRIELDGPGYSDMTINVSVQPGQVIPYRGEMEPRR